MFAAFVSVFFAGVSWYQSFGSKKAKKKAEEAHQAALMKKQMAVNTRLNWSGSISVFLPGC